MKKFIKIILILLSFNFKILPWGAGGEIGIGYEDEAISICPTCPEECSFICCQCKCHGANNWCECINPCKDCRYCKKQFQFKEEYKIIPTKKDFTNIENSFVNAAKLKENLILSNTLPDEINKIISEYFFEDWILYETFKFPQNVYGLDFINNTFHILSGDNLCDIPDSLLKTIANFFCHYSEKICLRIPSGRFFESHYSHLIRATKHENSLIIEDSKQEIKFDNTVNSFCFSPDNNFLFILTGQNDLYVYFRNNIIKQKYFEKVNITYEYFKTIKPCSCIMIRD